ncbi:RBBP9/YdeN family alpha/beta hydrolase [Saccharospirillum mangrovi]|uniref:RBBP9/YdeN family alpha/beta hydrolase n=1 Tax=Saccharospirillum mangrovi TaxID=2161747 RepID=UPI000D3648BB|nr:alpha/beta hydrolase [Saccharospirillum mangrovi]
MTPLFLILPGYGDSNPAHWQSRWQQQAAFERVQQDDWLRPNRHAWVARLDAAVQRHAGRPVVLVAHSLGCLTTAFWAAQNPLTQVQGALLVAPPDPEGANFPTTAEGFDEPPMRWLPFPSTLVMSTNDPYASTDFAERCAQAWGSRLVNLGECGHINHDSELGDWPAGQQLLHTLLAGDSV